MNFFEWFCFQVYKSAVDFFTKDYEQLQNKEKMGLYPPRFCVVITCTATARLSHARIEFRGAVDEDLVFDVPLNPPSLPQATLKSPGARSLVGVNCMYNHM